MKRKRSNLEFKYKIDFYCFSGIIYLSILIVLNNNMNPFFASDIFLDERDKIASSLKTILLKKESTSFIQFLEKGLIPSTSVILLDHDPLSQLKPIFLFEWWADNLTVLKALVQYQFDLPKEISKNPNPLNNNAFKHDHFLWEVILSPHAPDILPWLASQNFVLDFYLANILHTLIERDALEKEKNHSRWIHIGKILLDLGVNPNLKDKENYTALMVAAICHQEEWVHLLLDYQVDWKEPHSQSGLNAMELSNHPNIKSIFLNRVFPLSTTSKNPLRL